ncbi:MAG: HEPN domain-containing protein [Candidatus Wallbacteria bacterium]|nr:HEPN domain-containing protein [Candidatus Wallbacteria bacterium]
MGYNLEVRLDAELWWKQGVRDLETARHCRQSGDHYAAAFFCQQSAEKALKGIYIELKRESSGPGHSLVFLGKQLGADRELLTFFRELNAEYVATRYPDAANGLPHENYDDSISERLIAGVEKVLTWLEGLIPKPTQS